MSNATLRSSPSPGYVLEPGFSRSTYMISFSTERTKPSVVCSIGWSAAPGVRSDPLLLSEASGASADSSGSSVSSLESLFSCSGCVTSVPDSEPLLLSAEEAAADEQPVKKARIKQTLKSRAAECFFINTPPLIIF